MSWSTNGSFTVVKLQAVFLVCVSLLAATAHGKQIHKVLLIRIFIIRWEQELFLKRWLQDASISEGNQLEFDSKFDGDYTNSVSGSAESFENRSARAELMERVVVLKRTVGMYETESTEMQPQYTVGPKGAVLDTSAGTRPIGENVFMDIEITKNFNFPTSEHIFYTHNINPATWVSTTIASPTH